MKRNNTSEGLKVTFIGNLAGGAYMMARPLARQNVKVKLLLSNQETLLSDPGWEQDEVENLPLIFFKYYFSIGSGSLLTRFFYKIRNIISTLNMLFQLLSGNIVHSFTGSLFQSRIWRFVFCKLRLKPYIACATGSDIREVAMFDTSENGIVMRSFFENSAKTLLLNLDMVGVSKKLGLKNAEFFPFSIDTKKYSPENVKRVYGMPEDLLIFMPSHLDWGITDCGQNRNSTKGNNRLIRAFNKLINEGLNAHLIILDRGPDRLLAKETIASLKLEKRVTILPQMKKQELLYHMRMADVVADQFDIGSFGTTGLEAMSCGKPLLIYINNEYSDECYKARPPIVNVKTEEEIYNGLLMLLSIEKRAEIGQNARLWILQNHDSKLVSERLLSIYKSVLNNEC